ncbi:MAG: hypothetical protein AAGI91_01720 [Bacteroidota bacterium]
MDDIWDEHRWEDFLRESDRRTDLYMRYWDQYVRRIPPPPEDAPEAAREAWERGLHAYLARKMGWDQHDGDLPLWLEDFDAEPEDDGEAWKAGLGEAYPEAQDVRDLPLYQRAFAFGSTVMDWAETVPEGDKDTVFVDFCSNALQVGAKVAGGHGMGYDLEALGGNIAVTKRGLHAANRALAALQQLRREPFMEEATYRRLYEQTYEVRNAVGLHVQHLRERFERGVE